MSQLQNSSSEGAEKVEGPAWVRVCSTKDFPKDGGKAYNVNGLQLAIFRSDGKFYATADCCTHEEESLSEGWLEGCHVECPRHGAMFDLKTGEALSLPATEALAVYPLRIDGADIFVGLPQT